MSHQTDPTSSNAPTEYLSPAIYIHRPFSANVRNGLSSVGTLRAPNLILLFSWTGAKSKHIAKYTSNYRNIFPATTIMVITTSINDLLYRSSRQRRQALIPAITTITSSFVFSTKILVHTFSEGSSTAVQLAKAFLATTGRRLPISALLLDSCPGTLHYTHLAASGRATVRHSQAAQILTSLVAYAVIVAHCTGYLTGNRTDALCGLNAGTRRDFNNSALWDTRIPRGYLFSTSDKVIEWQSLVAHAREAIHNGTPVFVTQFENSAHCAHIMDPYDAQRYWETVQAVWNSRHISAVRTANTFDEMKLSSPTVTSISTPPSSAFSPSSRTSTAKLFTDPQTGSTMSNDEEALRSEIVEWKPHKQEYSVMITLAMISLMVALDSTIIVPVLPTLAKDLHGTATDTFWAGTSYLLTCAVFQPFIAALSDIFGRRELLLPCLLLFSAGSITCALSHGFTQLLAGRCIQGVGGGGVITSAQIVFADIIPLRQRPKYFSLVLAAWALGTILGPIIGGVIAEKTSWRWAFWINLPFCAFGLIVIPVFFRFTTRTRTTLKEKVLRVDFVGAFLFIASLTSFLVAISRGGIECPWFSYQTLVPLIVGLLGLAITLIWERFGAQEPFLPRSLFQSTSPVATYVCALLQGLTLFCALYYFPFYLMAVRFKSPIAAGVDCLPNTCAFIPGSVIVSVLITRLGRFQWAIWLGWIIATVGGGLFILLDVDTHTIVWVVALMVFGVGSGMVLSSLQISIQTAVRTEECGRAASMYAFMRTVGQVVGVAVGGTVFQNQMAVKLKNLALPVDIASNAEQYITLLRTMTATERVGPLEAYVSGFRGVFEVLLGISALGLLLSLLIKHHSMDKILESRYRLDR